MRNHVTRVSKIDEFYRDKSILITGSTGFMGKVLLEKLLRSCPGISNIYLLIRPKGNQTIEARLKAMTNCKIFKALQQCYPAAFSKLIAVSGDVLLPGLGISASDKKTLTDNVNIVFHVAASIRFDDTLKFATQMNVMGSLKVVQLCKNMANLEALVHVSTAYSHCNRKDIGEEIYEAKLVPEQLLSIVDWMQEEVLESISAKLVGDRITTYHLTKGVTEKVLQDESANIPIVIVRPSVVVGAWKEPIPGWTETLYHINGILVAAGRGVLRVLQCNPDSVVDIVPVDVAVNLLIASAYSKSQEKDKNSVTVFNCVSGVDRPLTYRQLRDYSLPALRNQPLLYPVWYPSFSLIRCKCIATFVMFFLHWIPAFFADGFLKLFGMEPKLARVVRRIERSQASSEFFLNNDFEFENKNCRSLWNSLNVEDKERFYFDMTTLQWPEYIEHYFLGCKQFVVKEDLSTLKLARKQMRRMWLLQHSLYWVLAIPLICWCIFSLT